MSNLASALLAAQKAMPHIAMDSVNPHFRNRFASLPKVLSEVLPILNEHGLVLMQHPSHVEGQPALRTVLIHAESSEHIEDTMLLMLGKNDPQGQGSALSYARRYAVMSTLGLVADEDDDGAAASRPKTSARAKPPVAKTDDIELQDKLGEIDVLVDALAVARKVDKTQVIAALDGDFTDWRTDVVSASQAVARLKIWANKVAA